MVTTGAVVSPPGSGATTQVLAYMGETFPAASVAFTWNEYMPGTRSV